MALTVVFVSGPRRAGKSTVIHQIACHCLEHPPHYLRLASVNGDKRQPVDAKPPEDDCGVASAQWMNYDQDRVFEFLPATMSRIHRRDRKGMVIIEADADPLLRHAYPYDVRIFVLPAPRRLLEVFRTSSQATQAFRATLDDTTVFAEQIFGLVEDPRKLDAIDPGVSEKRSSLTPAQLKGLMNSPLGDELATRILLQPTHHGLVESDVIVVNTAVGGATPVVDECVRRLETVLSHVRAREDRKHLLFACDPADRDDPLRNKFIARTCALIRGHCECDDDGQDDEG